MNMNKPLRDFLEGLAAAIVGGAATAVLAAAGDATAKMIVFLALTGAASSAIAYSRRYLTDVFPPQPPQ
jgi:hypothetical protein